MSPLNPPSSPPSPGDAFRIAATGTFTRGPAGQLLVQARSDRFVARALHPMARVGSVAVIGVTCSDGVLRGMLLGTPREGDELIVSYPPEPELRTGVTFRPTAP